MSISLRFRRYELTKRVALMISRGSSAGSTSCVVEIECDGIIGLGEAAEFEIPGHGESIEQIERDLATAAQLLGTMHATQRWAVETRLRREGIGASVRAAIDMALYDWMGKSVGLPVWKLLGFERLAKGPVSVTVGINTPQGAQERLRKWHELGVIRGIKVKLGSPAGMEADKAMLSAIKEIAPPEAYIGVDANGGWDVATTISMSRWLREQGVIHIEQPLPVDQVEMLRDLHGQCELPLFIDESCRSAKDVLTWGPYVDGINIKITKVGGLSEAMRMIAIAKTMGLQTMVGCYGNIALGNGAAHQLASLIDYIDLDSHLNISNDPTQGQPFENGYLVNQDTPGLGIQYA